MGKKVMSKDELLKNKEQYIEKYSNTHSKSKKPVLLTKKERKILGIGKDEGRATIKYVRISSRKAKIVLDIIRGKDINEAYGILKHTPKAASAIILKLLQSAEANAVNNNELDRDSLYVAEAYANQGPTYKRVRPRARGSAFRIRKRTSHITLVLKERK
ncbi:MAG: 50S ribosomal protein L22 [Clostridiaceae bacterium]|nr:50S ribosomal protein L22 [Clostridiaceae bacterium]